jgi:hypothetical protein
MVAQAPSSSQQVLTMQGIQVPTSAVNPTAFFANTRRQNLLMKTIASFAGLGSTDLIPVMQTGIVSHIRLRVYGSVTITVPSGTAATNYAWPYGLIRQLRFTANGQSNLISCSGPALKLLAAANSFPRDDRGVPNAFGGASPGTTFTQGTLAQASEAWGVGSGVTGLAAGTYNFDLTYAVPVAFDDVTLLGAIFAQTQSTDLELAVDWNTPANLFALTGAATATVAASVQAEGTVYTIPSSNGGIVIPNLSAFHSVTESRAPNAISTGTNEITLAGQGVGRQLMRLAFRVINNGSSTLMPLAMSDTNFSTLYWRYGGNTTPETFSDGKMLRHFDEALYNCDVGALYGYGVFDFSSLWAQRDSIDEGSATQLRFGYNLNNGVTLTNPYCEYVQQAIIAGAVAA